MNDGIPGVDERLSALARSLPTTGRHLDEDTWVALQTGALTRSARRAVADHIGTCSECAQVYHAIEQLAEGARSRQITPPDVASPAVSRAFILMAAALVAAIAFVAWQDVRSRANAPAATRLAGQDRATPAPPPAAATAPVREWALALAAPPVELPARYALITRGADKDRAFLEAFGPAIAPYRDGNYIAASAALGEVATRFPDVPEAAFYLGVARLMAGDAAGARVPLARAEAAESLGDAARWFGAAAAERTSANAEADALLAAVCRSNGAFSARACTVLGTQMPRE